MNPDNIPNTLKDIDRWLNWQRKNRGGKGTKVPIDPRTGRVTSVTDPQSWSDFETVAAAADRFDGVGFVFIPTDDFLGIDFDNCLAEDESLLPWARDYINALTRITYVEVSPSGRGVKAFLRGAKPGTDCKETGLGEDGKGAVEIYDSGRYFTVTGKRLPDARDDVFDAQEEIDRIYSDIFGEDESKQAVIQPDLPSGAVSKLTDLEVIKKARGYLHGMEFVSIWQGDNSFHNGDASAADLAACNTLAFFSGGDAAQIDRLFRTSDRMRPKWDEKHKADGSTYGEITIVTAIAGQTSFYKGAHQRSEDAGKNRRSEPDEEPTAPKPVSLSYDIADYQIKLDAQDSRRTNTKCTISWDIVVSRQNAVRMDISTAGQSIKNTAGELANMVGFDQALEGRKIRAALCTSLREIMHPDRISRIHRHLTDLKRNAPHEGGENMQQILIRLAPKSYGLAFKNDDGSLFSELYGRDISRQEFCQSMTEELATACKGAVDYPNIQHQSAPVSQLVSLMRLVWGVCQGTLPSERGADLGPESKAARRYADVLKNMFQVASASWVKSRSGHVCDSDAYSLAANAARWALSQRSMNSTDWLRLPGCSGLDVWICTRTDDAGNTDVWLGLTHNLPRQLNTVCRVFKGTLPNTRDNDDLKKLATRYGLTATAFDETPPSAVFVDTEHGQSRDLVALSVDITAQILGLPRTGKAGA